MGYAGYYSTTNQIKEKKTPLQCSLAQVSDLDSLTIIEKLCYNVIVNPKESKYRQVKLQNPKIESALVKVPNALDVMLLLGWTKEEDSLLLKSNVQLTMAQVRDVQSAFQTLKKQQK